MFIMLKIIVFSTCLLFVSKIQHFYKNTGNIGFFCLKFVHYLFKKVFNIINRYNKKNNKI